MESIVKITVTDIGRFIAGVKASELVRDTYGVRISAIYKSTTNLNELFIISEYADMESMNAYLQSAELAAAMAKSGVAGMPELWKVERIRF